MNDNIISMIFHPAVEALKNYIALLAIPLLVLVAVMVLDYVTGVVKAWITKTLSSEIGVKGLVKKLSYLGLVAVSMVIDWLIKEGTDVMDLPISFKTFVGAFAIILLILNELISILENIKEIGGPQIPFLSKLLDRLKLSVNEKAEHEFGDDKPTDENGEV